ncbi:MAG TPA: DUF3782 domain-containing protein [Sulfolobales archaeon]|nr:DUF3782 domain-containing protein [Sulfolobales archaeon]
MDSNVESTEKMLGEIKRIVKEAIEESKREDIIKLGTAIDKIADVLKSMLEELKKHTEILEKHTKILEEHTKILERHTKILEEHSEMLKEHGKTLMELKIAVGSLGKRVGRDLEKMILSLYKDNLAQLGIDPEKARRFIYTDLDGKLGVRGARYEFDVIIEDGGVTIIEVKSKAERGDIDWLYDRVERTRQLIGNVKRIVIIAVNIDREALERARELGINTIYGSVID